MLCPNSLKSVSTFVVTLVCCFTVTVLNWDRRLVYTTDNAPRPMFYNGRTQKMSRYFSKGVTLPVAYTTGTSAEISIPTYQSVTHAYQIKYRGPNGTLTEQGNVGMINGEKTVVVLKNADRHVKVGDFFSVIIEARDSKGSHRIKGGDFLFANLRSSKANAAGKIFDFDNGTYEAIFFAAWSGVFSIEIILVHPSETVDYIERELWPMEKRIMWRENFKANKISEYKLCWFTKKGVLLDKCEYSQPLALGKTSFVCDRPTRLSCDTFVSFQPTHSYVNKLFSNLYESHRTLYHPSVTYTRLTNGISSINIGPSDVQSTLMERISLPECKPDLPTPLSDGFWTTTNWTSLQCKTKQWTKPEIIQCIKGKEIIFMGDSTTMQWSNGMLTLVGVAKSKYTSTPTSQQIRHHSDIMTFDFYFHPYRISLKTQLSGVSKWEYEIIDNLNSTACNYIIMVSPFAHYCQWLKESYIERLQLLRDSLIKFMKRCPNAHVLMKTPHARDHKTNISLLNASDRLLYDMYGFYHEIFSGLGIHIIDVWDMNQAHPHVNTMHMPMQIVYQELFMMFSHICTVE